MFQTVSDPRKQQCVSQAENGKAYMLSVLLVLLCLLQRENENANIMPFSVPKIFYKYSCFFYRASLSILLLLFS